MSNLRVNKITNEDEDGSVTFSKGLGISSSFTIQTEEVIVVGIFTATGFVGDGSGLTNTSGVSVSKAITLSLI